jgi:hypothetical protein
MTHKRRRLKSKKTVTRQTAKNEGNSQMPKLYQSAKHPQHWIAYLDGMGWTMFPAVENGWEKRQPARGVDPMHLRQVPMSFAAGTGMVEALENLHDLVAA